MLFLFGLHVAFFILKVLIGPYFGHFCTLQLDQMPLYLIIGPNIFQNISVVFIYLYYVTEKILVLVKRK